MDRTFLRSTLAAAAVCCVWHCAAFVHAEVLLDDRWADASRAEANRPKEAPVWVGREGDVSLQAGALTTAMGPSSQKIWTYFTDKEPVKLDVGHKLTASVSFIPRGALSEGTSRSFRIGLFHDSTSPRVETNVNNDSGGADMPWKDARGYAVQVLVTGDEFTGTKPFDLGKRLNMESAGLLGTSGDYSKVSGGSPVGLKLDQQYTVALAVERVSEKEVELTASFLQGENVLSTWSVIDDGSYLGSEPVYDQFDMLFIRISDNATTADKLEFTNFKVETTTTTTAKQPN
jgi:hypothetical protein